MTLRDKIIKYLSENKKGYKNHTQFISILSKKTGESSNDINKCIYQMIKEGFLIEDNKRQLRFSEELGYKKGIISGNRRGFAFIRPLNKNDRISKTVEDLFVAPPNLFGAFDGDEVLYKTFGDSAEVVKILKRKNIKLVGTVISGKDIEYKNRQVLDNNIYVLVDNGKFSKPISLIKKDLKFAKIGDKVEIKLIHQSEGKNTNELPVGSIMRVLEKNSDIENGIISILCENDIAEGFPENVVNAAEELKTDYQIAKKQRVDLTNELIMTIDGEDAKDFDDAISISKTSEGYTLGVHIADVGEYVKQDSVLDKEAFERGTSVYFPGRVYPMLPEKISNDLCSLRPNEDKLAVSVIMDLDVNGRVNDYKIFQSVIKSSARLTYNQVYDVIKSKEDIIPSRLSEEFPKITDKKIKDSLHLMNELSCKIRKRREMEGMLDFNIPETQFDMDGDTVLDVRARDSNEAHKLIENFMVLCNEVVARHFCTINLPFVYRVHEPPKHMEEAVSTLNEIGITVKEMSRPTPKQVQQILKSLKENSLNKIGDKIILKAMDKARYQDDCLGHFGLAINYYCHFTSPIRRYPDLTIHRIIKKACESSPEKTIKSIDIENPDLLKNLRKNRRLENFVHLASLQSSQRELRADDASRAADDLFKAKFMENKIGQEFKGVISGLTDFGIFVELPNTVEGMIKVENLPGHSYKYNPTKLTLSSGTRKYTIGDEIAVRVFDVRVNSREIEFTPSKEQKLNADFEEENNTKKEESVEKKESLRKKTSTTTFCL